jgi:flagellar L-ring protein precursor FlgH
MKILKKWINMPMVLVMLALLAPMLIAQSDDPPAPRHKIASWTADRREYEVGDVITVLVSEATLASATKSQSGSDQTTRKNDMGIDLPKVGPLSKLPNVDGTMSTDKNSSSKQTGDATRGVNFRGDISVRVVEVDKRGQLKVQGTKQVDVDKNKQKLEFTGWIRPEDVGKDNVVASERVADVNLTYQLNGDIGKTRGGLVGRLLSVFWP